MFALNLINIESKKGEKNVNVKRRLELIGKLGCLSVGTVCRDYGFQN
jgi:hypothetical protein